MKTRLPITITLALASLVMLPDAVAQRNASGSGRSSRTTQTSRSTSSRQSARPAKSGNQSTSRPGNASSSSRSTKSSTKKATPVRTDNKKTQTVRKDNSAKVRTDGSSSVRPGGNGSSTSRSTKSSTKKATPVRTDDRKSQSVRHDKNSSVRPGNGGSPQHGGNSAVRPGNGGAPHHGGSSAPRPGNTSYRPGPRPHYDYCHHDYRPPRPNGGYWGPPPVNHYRPVCHMPPPPPRPVYVNYTVPTIGNILGLAFGSFIDAGINTLFNTGYTVLGYVDNAIYLSNVRQLGYVWPEATVYYTDGLMSNTQFQYWTPAPDVVRFNNVYRQLVSIYGAPVSSNTINGITTVSWWGGSNTGYVTLQYGLGNSIDGLANYYTTLTYSDGYGY